MPPEVAAAHPYTDVERARLQGYRDSAFIGTADKVMAQIRQLADATGVQEIAIVTWATDEAARQKSYALLAAAAGLPAG